MTYDPFDTAGIRERVLTAWAASPARFREDANAEEDLALGGYRDRVVVELAQNAADAAARAGVPGRLLLAVRELEGQAVLVAANTGAPLDAEGVSALATLRASAKREGGTVGRFGVGFAAVLSVTDEPAVVCRGGGVRFSAADTRLLVADAGAASPSLGDELTRRDGHVPALRLPFATEGMPPDGYDTAVILPLRDAAAEELILRLLDDVDDALLLSLPALAEVTVERPGAAPVTVRDVADRWHVLHREGRHDAAVLADRPTEERGADTWSLTWALPRSDGAGPPARAPGVLRAPTPTDEPLPWPALLLASFPLDTSRRHVAAGPASEALAGHAAAAYADLLADRAADGADVWHLLPHGAPAGAVDAALRAALADVVPGAQILHAAEDAQIVLRPRDAVVLEPPAGTDREVVTALAPWVAGLVLRPRGGPPPGAYGVRELPLADLVDALPAVENPARWRSLYAALAPLAVDTLVREALAGVPVPLADGSVVRAPRGLVLLEGPSLSGPSADGAATAGALVTLGVRTVHPDAAHPLLERLGAVPSSARAVLDLPAVRTAVERAAEEDEPAGDPLDGDPPGAADVADAVLHLVSLAVAAGSLEPGDLPWLGDLVLTDDEGDPAPAAALALPGSDAERWFDTEDVGVVAADLVTRWGPDVLATAGVLTGPALLRAHEVPLDADAELADELDGWDDWVGHVHDALADDGRAPAGVSVPELLAVRDLDLLRPDSVPEAVVAIAADPRRRPALVARTHAVVGSSRVDVDPYTAWWVRDRLGAPLAAGGALAGLLPAAPEWLGRLDPVARRAVGVVAGVADIGADAVPDLLRRLADPAVTVGAAVLLDVLQRLGELAADGAEAPPPAAVRCLDGAGTRVVPATEAVVVDAPMYRQRTDLRRYAVPARATVAAALADLLDLPLARELAPGRVEESEAAGGVPTDVPPAALALLPAAPRTWCEHEQLVVDGVDVAWWVEDGEPGGRVHAATLDGLALALAWSGGRWDRRAAVAEVLGEPEALGDVLADEAFAPS